MGDKQPSYLEYLRKHVGRGVVGEPRDEVEEVWGYNEQCGHCGYRVCGEWCKAIRAFTAMLQGAFRTWERWQASRRFSIEDVLDAADLAGAPYDRMSGLGDVDHHFFKRSFGIPYEPQKATQYPHQITVEAHGGTYGFDVDNDEPLEVLRERIAAMVGEDAAEHAIRRWQDQRVADAIRHASDAVTRDISLGIKKNLQEARRHWHSRSRIHSDTLGATNHPSLPTPNRFTVNTEIGAREFALREGETFEELRQRFTKERRGRARRTSMAGHQVLDVMISRIGNGGTGWGSVAWAGYAFLFKSGDVNTCVGTHELPSGWEFLDPEEVADHMLRIADAHRAQLGRRS